MRVFDAHCDTIYLCHRENASLLAHNEKGHWDLPRARAYAGFAQFFALFASPEACKTKSPAQIFREQYRIFREEVNRNQDAIAACHTAKQAQQAIEQGKVAAFLSVEGAEMLSCSLAGLEQAHAFGVRAMNLTWNRANLLCGSSAEDNQRGLSSLGRAFVTRMQQLGILVDVSHLSDPGFWDVMDLSQAPVIASHSNARSVCDHPRNLTDGQISALAKTGGVIGLNLYGEFLGGEADFAAILRHIEHICSLTGEDHIALGGDWDGCDSLAQGFSGGLAGLAALDEYLAGKNYTETQRDKLFFGNMERVVASVCTM